MPERPRYSRPWMFGIGGTAAMLATLVFISVWMYGHRPPDCSDHRTLALVRQQLDRIFGNQPMQALVRITTVAGGPIAIRFACSADFAKDMRLPNGALVDTIHYSSMFVPHTRLQRVTVQAEPLLAWLPVY